MLSSGTGSAAANQTSAAKSKHNAKSVSDLIAALPPSLDFLIDESTGRATVEINPEAKAAPAASAGNSMNGNVAAAASSAAALRKSPLFSSPGGIATPGAPAAASLNVPAEKVPADKRGFIKLPLGRNDYGMKPKTSVAASAAILAASAAAGAITGRAPASIDENIAKTFPTVFPHLGSLAGKAAANPTAANPTAAKSATGIEFHSERPLATHFGSAVLDTLVSVGLGCVLLALALSVTNVNLLALLENSQTDQQTILALSLLFVAGGLLYVLAARSFLGATLGEWSYEIRVGERDKRSRWFYPILVMWRGVLVTATGFVSFPIISAILGKDVLKYLTGLELVGVDGASPTSANE